MNYFQGYDIPLTNGWNTITLYATDLAGNTTTTNVSFTLDYSGDTTAPVVSVVWPPDGTSIVDTNFTLQATVDDATATITTAIVDGSGDTNTVTALVESNGKVWAKNLPLGAGANTLTITATDAAGNASTNSLTVYQSGVLVTVDPLSQLNQASVTVTGTISDPSYEVTVNGIMATVNSDGTWAADGVPVAPAGAAILDVEVAGGSEGLAVHAMSGGLFQAKDSSSDTTDGSKQFVVPQPPTVVLSSYAAVGHYTDYYYLYPPTDDPPPNFSYNGYLSWDETVGWSYDSGGWFSLLGEHGNGYLSGSMELLPDGSGYVPPDFYGADDGPPLGSTFAPVWEQADAVATYASVYTTVERNIQTGVMIAPARPDVPGTARTYLVRACASECSGLYAPYEVAIDDNGAQVIFSLIEPALYAGDVPLPPDWLRIQHQTLVNTGITNTDGAVWGCTVIQAAAGATADATPTATRVHHYWDYTFDVKAAELYPPFVDANRDGQIASDGSDATSAGNPYRFWVNNDYDGYDSSIDDYADLDPSTGDDANNTSISCTRDLEDYTRLWINTQGLTTDLKNGNLLLALEWKNATDDPGMQFFQAAEINGGALYLTDTNVAAQQVSSYGLHVIEWAHRNVLTKYNPFIFPTSFWSNVSADQPVAHLLFDAVSRGSGQLVVVIYKKDGTTKLAEGPPLYLKLQDVKEMYERYTVGDDPSSVPATTASIVADPYSYDSTIPAVNNYILFVHGWNLPTWEKDAFAETAFKRLYWQGYKGHFGSFRWPTGYGFDWESLATDPHNYNNSESNAWASATGLLGKLNDLNATYPSHVYLMAHSMGNVVAGEALKQASGQVVNTYVAMQGAVPSHCYDPNATIRTIPYPLDSGTPNRYANYYTNGAPCYFNGTAGAGSYINFYNQQDWALSYWQDDQNLKPQTGYGYNDTDQFYRGILTTTPLYFPANTYEIFAYADEARCFALGAQANVGGVFKVGETYRQIELDIAPYNFGLEHKDHSGEFNSDNMSRSIFWNTALQQMNLKP
jgi:hypothetical protein